MQKGILSHMLTLIRRLPLTTQYWAIFCRKPLIPKKLLPYIETFAIIFVVYSLCWHNDLYSLCWCNDFVFISVCLSLCLSPIIMRECLTWIHCFIYLVRNREVTGEWYPYNSSLLLLSRNPFSCLNPSNLL